MWHDLYVIFSMLCFREEDHEVKPDYTPEELANGIDMPDSKPDVSKMRPGSAQGNKQGPPPADKNKGAVKHSNDVRSNGVTKTFTMADIEKIQNEIGKRANSNANIQNIKKEVDKNMSAEKQVKQKMQSQQPNKQNIFMEENMGKTNMIKEGNAATQNSECDTSKDTVKQDIVKNLKEAKGKLNNLNLTKEVANSSPINVGNTNNITPQSSLHQVNQNSQGKSLPKPDPSKPKPGAPQTFARWKMTTENNVTKSPRLLRSNPRDRQKQPTIKPSNGQQNKDSKEKLAAKGENITQERKETPKSSHIDKGETNKTQTSNEMQNSSIGKKETDKPQREAKEETVTKNKAREEILAKDKAHESEKTVGNVKPSGVVQHKFNQPALEDNKYEPSGKRLLAPLFVDKAKQKKSDILANSIHQEKPEVSKKYESLTPEDLPPRYITTLVSVDDNDKVDDNVSLAGSVASSKKSSSSNGSQNSVDIGGIVEAMNNTWPTPRPLSQHEGNSRRATRPDDRGINQAQSASIGMKIIESSSSIDSKPKGILKSGDISHKKPHSRVTLESSLQSNARVSLTQAELQSAGVNPDTGSPTGIKLGGFGEGIDLFGTINNLLETRQMGSTSPRKTGKYGMDDATLRRFGNVSSASSRGHAKTHALDRRLISTKKVDLG